MNLTTKLKNIMPSTQRKVFVYPESFPEEAAVAPPAAEKKDPAATKDTATPSADAPKKSSAEEIPAPRRRSHKPAHKNRRKVVGARGRSSAPYGTNIRVPNDDEAQMSARNLRRIKRRLFLEAVNADQPASVKPRNSMRHEVSCKKSLRKGKE